MESGFENIGEVPYPAHARVAQLVRAPPCHGGGREFESRPVRLHCAET